MTSDRSSDNNTGALDARRLYEGRVARFHKERGAVATRSGRLSNLRLIVFLLAVVAAIAAVDFPSVRLALSTLAAAFMALFFGLVALFRRAQRELDALEAMVTVNEEARARVERDWDALEVGAEAAALPAEHPYAEDLDLFGNASLMRLLGSVRTAPGNETLSAWLCNPAPPRDIAARQQAVAELAPLLEFRQQLEAQGLGVGNVSGAQVEGFLQWAESTDAIVEPAAAVSVGRVVGPLMGAAGVWLFVIWLLGSAVGVLWIVPIFVNALLTGAHRKRIHASLDVLSACEEAFLRYAKMLETIVSNDFASQSMKDLVARVRLPNDSALKELRRIHGLVHLGDVRRSSGYFFLQILLLWDFHVASGLIKWRQRSGQRARGWLEALGSAEALSALAGLAHDNPHWIVPEVDPNGPSIIDARGLGHPLLNDGVRVVNDVQIGPAHTFLLVTGSNMSGKSTLLRAIGVNVVLAQAGSVVCATRFSMRPLKMYTSVRVHDSLAQGVSYFMAGVMRLKSIVDAARSHRRDNADFLYLLDEILQGTNTAERQVAVRNILGELLGLETIGAVTTHDLTLADTNELRQASHPVHFSEVIEPNSDADEATLSFDYKLRPGIATSTNALRLLKLMGVVVDGG
ncbi:MAG: hypothetical protein IH876_16060 [Gemmatimonadetes bacterium]|nr:hypothetical protein [Gemmatimonadota bacterium]